MHTAEPGENGMVHAVWVIEELRGGQKRVPKPLWKLQPLLSYPELFQLNPIEATDNPFRQMTTRRMDDVMAKVLKAMGAEAKFHGRKTLLFRQAGIATFDLGESEYQQHVAHVTVNDCDVWQLAVPCCFILIWTMSACSVGREAVTPDQASAKEGAAGQLLGKGANCQQHRLGSWFWEQYSSWSNQLHYTQGRQLLTTDQIKQLCPPEIWQFINSNVFPGLECNGGSGRERHQKPDRRRGRFQGSGQAVLVLQRDHPAGCRLPLATLP